MNSFLPEKYLTWKRSAAYSMLLTLAYVAGGLLIATSWVDNNFSDTLKVLHEDNVLAYLAVVLAIQIPIFMLFLQEMVNAGFVKRKILPRISGFKEIVTLLLTGSFLVVISPREAFLYVPLVLMALINIVAVFRAIMVIFHQDQYENDIKTQLKNISSKSFIAMDKRRRVSNKKFSEIENTQFIDISYWSADTPDTKVIPIKAKAKGILDDFDVKGIANLLSSEFEIKKTREATNDNAKKNVPRVQLKSTLFYKVKADETFADLIVPVNYEHPEKLGKKIEKYFNINTKQTRLPIIKDFDEILLDFERAIDLSIRNSDINLLKDTFGLLRYMLDEMDEAIESEDINKKDDKYRLNEAYQELTMLTNDEFSTHLRRMYEMLSDNLTKCIIENKDELAHEFISLIYGEMLNAVHSKNLQTIARNDSAMSFAIGQFLFNSSLEAPLTNIQKALRDSLFHRLKEHTSLLRYELKGENGQYDPEDTIQQWFERRVTRLRELTLASISRSNDNAFTETFNILQEVERDAEYDKLSDENEMFIRCNLFMIAAYLRHRNMLGDGHGKSVLDLVKRWTDQELLDVLLECYENEYAGNWNIDTYDHPRDGQMRSVPDYVYVMKQLWADIMLERSFSTDPDHYFNKAKLEETLLFTNSLSNNENNDLLNYLNEMQSSNTAQLKELVENLIKVRRDWENTKLSKMPLDITKVNKFDEEVNSAYLESSVVAKAFKPPLHIAQDRTNATKDFKEFGINQIFDKEAFIKEWHSGYITDHMAEQLGRQTAQGQDKYVFEKLLSEPTTFSNADDFTSAAKKLKGQLLVISNQVHGFEFDDVFKKQLSRKSDYNDQYIKGLNQHIPIQTLFAKDIPRGIYIVANSDMGKVFHKSKANHPVKVAIVAYSHDDKLKSGLLKASPEWLQKHGSKEEQEKFLNTKARMYVAYIFKYEAPANLGNVLFLPVTKDY